MFSLLSNKNMIQKIRLKIMLLVSQQQNVLLSVYGDLVKHNIVC